MKPSVSAYCGSDLNSDDGDGYLSTTGVSDFLSSTRRSRSRASKIHRQGTLFTHSDSVLRELFASIFSYVLRLNRTQSGV